MKRIATLAVLVLAGCGAAHAAGAAPSVASVNSELASALNGNLNSQGGVDFVVNGDTTNPATAQVMTGSGLGAYAGQSDFVESPSHRVGVIVVATVADQDAANQAVTSALAGL